MRIASLGSAVILSFTLLARIGSAQAAPDDESARLAAARQATASNPASYEAWTQRLGFESMWAAMHNPASSEADRREAGERRFRELLAEWKAARPHDGGPFLLEIYRDPDAAARPARILALAARFPDDPVVLEHASRALADQGKPTQAAELLESFVESHPDVPRGFELLAAAYAANGNRPAANEVAADWLRRFPGEAAALSAWLRSSGQETSPAAVEDTVAKALPGLLEKPLTPQTLDLCEMLSGRSEGGLAALGLDCLDQISERGATPAIRQGAARSLLARRGAGGDRESALAALDALPPEERLATSRALASRLRVPEECERIVEIFQRLISAQGQTRDMAKEVAEGVQWCSETFAARELYVGLFASAPAESLPRLIFAWRTRVNGRFVQDLPVDRLVPIVQRRWAERKGDPAIAEALDLLYEAGGLRAERLALLRSEGAEGRWPRNPSRLTEFAEEEIAAGDPEVGVELLQGALTRSPDDARAFRACAEALLVLDRKDKALALAERGLASDSEAIRGSAQLVLARLAVRDENLDAALTHYRAALDSAVAVREVSDELFFVLALAHRENQIPAIAEELCAGRDLREPGQSVETCVAAALGRAGEIPAAAKYFESALEQAAQKPELYNDVARALSATGDRTGAERAIRQRIALDPGNEGGWAELGMVLLQAEDLEAHARVLSEAERALGAPSMSLRYQHAKLQLATGDARGAIETLLAMQKLRPDLHYFDELLRAAYRQLGAEP